LDADFAIFVWGECSYCTWCCLKSIPPEGRARIAEAVKRRWAAQKKAAK
jgi:hypothetical protein